MFSLLKIKLALIKNVAIKVIKSSYSLKIKVPKSEWPSYTSKELKTGWTSLKVLDSYGELVNTTIVNREPREIDVLLCVKGVVTTPGMYWVVLNNMKNIQKTVPVKID